MIQILKKQKKVLTLSVGQHAYNLISKEGLQAYHVDTIPGATGGPKGIGIPGLDQAIFGQFLPQSQQRRTLIGSSIGSWCFASILASGAKDGTEKLAHLCTNLYFTKKMSHQEVSNICFEMLMNSFVEKTQYC